MNLLTNTVHALAQAAPERRQILICARRQSTDAALISIEDQGPRITDEVLPKLFEPFFTTRDGGLGMGLAICRRIVEAGGGRICAENTGQGARFSFTLPLANPAPVSKPVSTTAQAHP